MNYGGFDGGGYDVPSFDSAPAGPASAGSATDFTYGVGTIIDAGADIYNTHQTNKTNKQIAEAANAASAAQAEKQMKFQELMSNTAYQRGIEDMKKAGLNPMLAYSQGGASSPSGAAGSVTTARMEKPNLPRVAEAIQNAIQTKMQARRDNSAIALQDTQKLQTEAGVQKTLADTEKTKAQTLLDIQEGKRQAEIHNNRASARALEKMEADADRDWFGYRKANERIQMGTETVQGASDAVWSMLGGSLFKKALSTGGSSARDINNHMGKKTYKALQKKFAKDKEQELLNQTGGW